MENSCNTRKIENVTTFQISLKWSHFLVTLFVTLLALKNCYNTKSEHFSNKNVTFCYIFALTPLIPPLLKNSDYFACNIFFSKIIFRKMLQNIFPTKKLQNTWSNIPPKPLIIHILRIIAVLSPYTFYPNNLSHQPPFTSLWPLYLPSSGIFEKIEYYPI